MIQQFQFWVYTLKIEIRISKTYLTALFTIAKIPIMGLLVHQPPFAALKNYHKLNGLRQYKFILLLF